MVTKLDDKTALVLIDLQNGIANMPLFKPASEVIDKAADLLIAFRAKKLPVIFINVNPLIGKLKVVRAEQNTLPTTEESAKQARTAMDASGFFNIVPQLQVQEDELLITKTTWNAFFQTSLHRELQVRGITGIVLAGIATSIGVEGTARSAHEFGYNIAFAQDAMSDLHQAAHDNSLTYIFPRIGEIDDTAAIITKVQELA